MQNNNYKILGILFLCEFALTFLIFLLFIGLFLLNSSLILFNNNDSSGFGSLFLIYALIILLYIIFMAPFGIAGWKLLKNKTGAKFWGVVASIFSLPFFFPLGIIISILGFVLLFSNNGNPNHQDFNAPPQSYNPPPTPQNWQ